MAKKKQSTPAPEVSNLPIKQDESPLVIDLPDGQKLVVGHLANGSVIEVATWRGTGRPDSRTSRLMLGMSSAAGAAEQAAAEEEKKKAEKKTALYFFQNFSKAITTFFETRKMAKAARPQKSQPTQQESAPFVKTVAPEPAKVQDDVQDWLDSIIAKSEKQASKPKAAVIKKAPAKKKAAVRKAAPKSGSRRARS